MKTGRLAMRREGNLWVAYYAMPETMENAIFLGSIQIRFMQDSLHKAMFIGLMQEVVGDMLEEITGERPTWPDPEGQSAPEHER